MKTLREWSTEFKSHNGMKPLPGDVHLWMMKELDRVAAERDALRGKQSILTSEQVVIIAKTMCSLQSIACGVDTEDNWKAFSEHFLTDARVIVDELNDAALGAKP